MTGVMIRAARRSDAEAIVRLWTLAGIRFSMTDEMRSIATRLKRDRDLFLVAMADRQLVGTLIAGWDGWRATMARLAVHPEYRGRRVARQLVEEAEARLRALGARKIGALVFADNELGDKFWRAAGYHAEPGILRFTKTLDD